MFQRLIASLLLSIVCAQSVAAQAPSHDFVLRWQAETGGTVSQTPAVVEGTVYAANTVGELHAVDLTSGQTLWSATTGSGLSLGPTVGDGTVFVANQAGPLAAFDAATGARLWVAEGVASPGSGAPVAAPGMVLVNRFGPAGAELAAIDAVSGQVMWGAPLGTATFGSPEVLEGRVYVNSQAASDAFPAILALDASSGETIWQSAPDAPLTLSGAADGLVFATGPAGLVALDAGSGEQMWTFQPGPNAPGGVWAVDGPVTDDGVLYAGTAIAMGGNPNPSTGGMVYALDLTTGDLLWETAIEGGVAKGPVVAGDIVAVSAGLQRGLYALDTANGEVAWYNPLRMTTVSALVAAAGWLVVAEQEGSLAGWQDLIAGTP